MNARPGLLLTLALALACAPAGKGATDLDGDGYGAEDDCDDQSAGISPAAAERCNGLDDDCDGEVDEPGADGAVEAYTDQDGDGFGAGDPAPVCSPSAGVSIYPGDCDDADAAVSPSATEVCDGIDDDCDGLTDEPGTPDGVEYPIDRDGDGYGHPTLTGVACAPGDGYAEDATDCDDGDPSRNPGAPEDCTNGVDDDCDGVIDEADDPRSPTWYLDGDGDGYGTPESTASSCAPPDSYVANANDCDDDDASVHPDQPDRTDGLDDDCDGEVDEPGDGLGSGTLVYDQLIDGHRCTLVWDTSWSELYPAPVGDYAWQVAHTWDSAASQPTPDCSWDHAHEDFTWDLALDLEGLAGGTVLWAREEGGAFWLPVFVATLDTDSGQLDYSVVLEETSSHHHTTTTGLTGAAVLLGL